MFMTSTSWCSDTKAKRRHIATLGIVILLKAPGFISPAPMRSTLTNSKLPYLSGTQQVIRIRTYQQLISRDIKHGCRYHRYLPPETCFSTAQLMRDSPSIYFLLLFFDFFPDFPSTHSRHTRPYRSVACSFGWGPHWKSGQSLPYNWAMVHHLRAASATGLTQPHPLK